MNQEALHVLLEKHAWGDLTDEEARELLVLVESDAEARKALRRFHRLNVLLETMADKNTDIDQIMRALPSSEQKRTDEAVLDTINPVRPVLSDGDRKLPITRIILLAASVLAVVGVVFVVQRESSTDLCQDVASVMSCAGGNVFKVSADNRQSRLEKGDGLVSGDTISVGSGSAAVIRTSDGSDVDLDQNTSIKMRKPSDRMTFNYMGGRLYCAVSKRTSGQRPFAVGLEPRGTVLAMGTAFEISNVSGRTTVAVDEGKVRIEGADGATRDAGQFQAVSMDQLGKIGEPEYMPAYSIAAWKFKQDSVPDGSIIFSEDFDGPSDGHLAQKLGRAVTVADGVGLNGGACAVFSVGPDQGTMNLVDGIRLKHWEMTFDLLVESEFNGYVGPSFGVPGSARCERFCTIGGRDGVIPRDGWISVAIVVRGNAVTEKWTWDNKVLRDVKGHISDRHEGCFDELGIIANASTSTRLRIDNIVIRKIASAPYEHVLFHAGFDDGNMSNVRPFKGNWHLAKGQGAHGDCIVMDWVAGEIGAIFMNCDLKNRDFTLRFSTKTPTTVGYQPVISMSALDLDKCVDVRPLGGGFVPGGMAPNNEWCQNEFSVKGGNVRHSASYKGALFYDRRGEIEDKRSYAAPGIAYVMTQTNCQAFLDDVVVTTPAE